MQLTHVVVIGAVLACLSPLQAQEMVENPEFTSWSKFKKGTSVTMKSTRVTKTKASEVIITNTLIDVGVDKLVIESSSVVKNEKEKDFKTEPEKREVKRIIPLPKSLTKEDFVASKPPGTTDEGTETLKFGTLELKTKWYKYSAEVAGIKIEGKRWVSSEMTVSIVKNEMTTTGEFSETNKLELLEIKKP